VTEKKERDQDQDPDQGSDEDLDQDPEKGRDQHDDDDGDDERERDEESADRAAAVAKALGVGDAAEQEEEEGEAEAGPQNRAERRRQRALARRRKAAGDEVPAAAAEEVVVGKDRNVRKREEILKRRKKASEAAEVPADRLLPSEMVDDALARGGDRVLKFLKGNWKALQWVITAVLLGVVGLVGWQWWSGKESGEASLLLGKALASESAVVIPAEEDDRTDEEKKNDLRTVYPSEDERTKAALDQYRQAAAESPGTGAAILARLGEAGVLLDRREWDAAISAYQQVIDSELGKADKDVKGRALEGRGFAEEGKAQYDDAIKAFERLGELGGDLWKATALYHQARMYLRKEQKDKAKELLQEALKVIDKGRSENAAVLTADPYRSIKKQTEEELRRIDPAAIPPKAPPGGAGALPDEVKRALEQKGLTPGIPGQ
jgi:tetratricopeptide (TPR) repeat protein